MNPKYDSRTGKQIKVGDRYRTFYRGEPCECYSLVLANDACTLAETPLHRRELIPAIEVCTEEG